MPTTHRDETAAVSHTATGASAESGGSAAAKDWALVWIDAREATVLRWDQDRITVQRIRSAVPPHRSSTGRVRQEGQAAAESRRLEHLARFVEEVAEQLNRDDAIAIVGPGTVREHLERVLRKADAGQHRTRPLTCEPSDRLTRAQLGERLRNLVGAPVRRHTLGAHRWTGPQETQPSGHVRPPRGVVEKPPRERHPVNEDDLEG